MKLRIRATRQRQHSGLSELVATFAALFLFNLGVLRWSIADFDRVVKLDEMLLVADSNRHNPSPPRESLRSSTSRRLEDVRGSAEYAFHMLKFDFFENQHREPTEREYQDLLCQTKAYYNTLLTSKIGAPVYTHLHPQDWTYDPDNTMPVQLNVTVVAKLDDDTPVASEVVNSALDEVANMTDYIQGYVWQAKPAQRSVFWQVGHVALETGVHKVKLTEEAMKLGSISLSNTMLCPATGIYEADFHFAFFPGSAREPMQSEVSALVPMTESFLTEVLQEEYFMHRVQVLLNCAGFSYDVTLDMPLVIKCQLSGRFVQGKDLIPPEYIQQKLTMNEESNNTMMQKYITKIVWETPPQAKSAFYEVKRAKMTSKIERMKYEVPVTRPPSLDGEAPNRGGMYENFAVGIGAPIAVTAAPSAAGTTKPLITITPVYNLDPIAVGLPECRQHVNTANANSDDFLTTDEYVSFVNMMTEDAFAGFPYAGLPSPLHEIYSSLSTKIALEADKMIDLVDSFVSNPSELELESMKDERSRKLCRTFLTVSNEAIVQGLLRASLVGSTVSVFLERETPPESEANDSPGTVVDLAFQNLVGDMVSPAMQQSAMDRYGLRRALGEDEKMSADMLVPSGAATIDSMDEMPCQRGSANDPKYQCFGIDATTRAFVTGRDAPEMAHKVGIAIQDVVRKAVADGDFTKELGRLDESTSWTARTIETPAPTNAPTSSPTISIESEMPTAAPTEAKEESSFTEAIGGKSVAAAAGTSVVIMIALQCGREFLVDLSIRCCKVCCKKYRKQMNEDLSENSHRSGNGSGGSERKQGGTEQQGSEFGSGRFSLSSDEEEQEEEEEEEEGGAEEASKEKGSKGEDSDAPESYEDRISRKDGGAEGPIDAANCSATLGGGQSLTISQAALPKDESMRKLEELEQGLAEDVEMVMADI